MAARTWYDPRYVNPGRPTGPELKEAVISSTIFVGNLPYETTEEELRTLLADADPGVRVRIGVDRVTGKPRGFAFAEFTDAAKAAEAVRRFDAQELHGRRLRVNDADDKPPPRAPRPMSVPSTAAFDPSAMPADFGRGDGDSPAFRRKGGSRRGLRGKKRSLRW